jgi:integrase
VFKDWQTKAITDIRKPQVSQRHRELGEQRGEAYANQAMRFLRAVLNFAQAQYDDGDGHSLLLENPVRVLTQTRSWYRVPRRRTVIKNHQLPAWYRGVEALRDPTAPDTAHTVADYLLLLLFTGLRRQEAVQLRWEHIDLK